MPRLHKIFQCGESPPQLKAPKVAMPGGKISQPGKSLLVEPCKYYSGTEKGGRDRQAVGGIGSGREKQ